MPQLSEYAFQFQSQAVAKDTFAVVRFHGEEGLSELYSFEILLVSEKADLDLESILQSVITSYSIHYTKLYDSIFWAMGISPGVPKITISYFLESRRATSANLWVSQRLAPP